MTHPTGAESPTDGVVERLTELREKACSDYVPWTKMSTAESDYIAALWTDTPKVLARLQAVEAERDDLQATLDAERAAPELPIARRAFAELLTERDALRRVVEAARDVERTTVRSADIKTARRFFRRVIHELDALLSTERSSEGK